MNGIDLIFGAVFAGWVYKMIIKYNSMKDKIEDYEKRLGIEKRED